MSIPAASVPEDFRQVRREYLPIVIIDQAETVAVVRCAQAVPCAPGKIVFLQQSDQITHPVFPVLQAAVTDGTELAAPERRFGAFPLKIEHGAQLSGKVGAVDPVVSVIPGRVVADEFPIFPIRADVARITHFAVAVERSRLKHPPADA